MSSVIFHIRIYSEYICEYLTEKQLRRCFSCLLFVQIETPHDNHPTRRHGFEIPILQRTTFETVRPLCHTTEYRASWKPYNGIRHLKSWNICTMSKKSPLFQKNWWYWMNYSMCRWTLLENVKRTQCHYRYVAFISCKSTLIKQTD